MSGVMLKLCEIEDLFHKVTTNIVSPSNPSDPKLVRISWPTYGAPAWKIGENVIFLQVIPKDDSYTRQRDISHVSTPVPDDVGLKIEYTRVHQVIWTAYGPDSFENIENIRNGIYLPEYRETLEKSNIYLTGEVSMPRRMPELFNGQWWERADFTANFNEYVKRESTVPSINSADIKLYTEKGEIK